MSLPIGTEVTTKQRTEALYSGMYKGQSCEYPEQYFESGMIGVIVATDSPSVRRNISQYVVEFDGLPIGKNKDEGLPTSKWRVRLDPLHVKPLV